MIYLGHIDVLLGEAARKVRRSVRYLVNGEQDGHRLILTVYNRYA
jgi:hypothetical protein